MADENETPVVETPAEAPAEATPAVEAAPAAELPKGAKAPLKSGNAPKGFAIKGSEASKQFHAEDSAVQVWVVPTDEELMIARHTREVLAG